MGLNTALNYTTGHWTVKSQVTDTIATAKTLSISDLDYAHDYARTEDEPDEAKVANITSATLKPAEVLRFARTDIKNVYANSDVPSTSQVEAKGGVRTLVEADVQLSAVNSVSGAELTVPVRAWVCVQVPTASFVSSAVMEYTLGRALAGLFSTGSTSISREEDILRGSLLP